MNDPSRRKLILGGLAATAGVAGLGVAARLAGRYGLIPPDHGGIYGPGETLTYASQRLLTRHSLAREFPRSKISNPPLANEMPPLTDEFKRLQAGGFADWRLAVDGLVDQPASFSLAQLKSYPSRSQVTMLQCEEGWSYIAEWTGVPLSHVLGAVGVRPQAKYVVYFSVDPNWSDSIDMADALHPQTFLAYGMNGGELPVGNGGPLRMRVPRQVGYKSVKFITRLLVTDNLKDFSGGSYAWYAGI
ncbi:MAG: molybdopterin-dependent oxidoreductase [Candidatus Acidiferrum sp.]